MPWCPKCNAEYQDGFTECSDCGVALVDNLEENVELVPFFQAEDKKIAEKLVSYLKYSNLPSELSFDEENQVFVVSIAPNMEKHARKLYQAFYFVEQENMAKNLSKDKNIKKSKTAASEDETEGEATETDEDSEMEFLEEDPDAEGFKEDEAETDEYVEVPEEEPEDEGVVAGAYVFKADRYRDLAGTVGIFLFFGAIGLVFVLLNVFGFLTVLNGWMPNLIMGAMFAAFLYVASSTNQKAKTIRAEIEIENKLTDDINTWLKENVTKEYLTSIYDDSFSEELNYIKMTETIKELLLVKFGNQNLSYLDRLVEEYYNNNF